MVSSARTKALDQQMDADSFAGKLDFRHKMERRPGRILSAAHECPGPDGGRFWANYMQLTEAEASFRALNPTPPLAPRAKRASPPPPTRSRLQISHLAPQMASFSQVRQSPLQGPGMPVHSILSLLLRSA